MPPDTTFRHFHDQLGTLKRRELEMTERSESLVSLAVEAVLGHDIGSAEAVIAGDRELDQMELEIEEMAVQLLALQQPMARDLRFIISAIKITSDLERVGDHGVNIAQAATRLATSHATFSPGSALEDMARRARQMLSDALDAFIRGDGALGRDVCGRDDQVDSLHDSIFRVLLTHMLADPRTIDHALDLMTVSRNLERVADLATNIAEDAVFVAEGKTIKHRVEGPAKPSRSAIDRAVGGAGIVRDG